jgi:hypothetical protein
MYGSVKEQCEASYRIEWKRHTATKSFGSHG